VGHNDHGPFRTADQQTVTTSGQHAAQTTRKRLHHSFDATINLNIKDLARKGDNWHGLLALLTDATIISAAIYLCTFSSIFYPLSLVVIGSRQRALATILHESSHRTLCRNYYLNKALGLIAGWSIAQSYYRYRRSHVLEHHPFLGDERRDPDTLNYLNRRLFERSHNSFIQKQFLLVFSPCAIFINVTHLINDRLICYNYSALKFHQKIEYCAFILFIILILMGVVLTGYQSSFIWFWVIPYIVTFQAINWIIELAEHFPLTRIFENDLNTTRNRMGGKIENFFTGIHGENWHLVHHLYPDVPFWLLSKAHNVMMRDLHYEQANANSGGLFVKGPNGQPSIVSIINEQLKLAQDVHNAPRVAS
jgi:fatty acid desaturase